MGNISSLASRYVLRKSKRFNVESRAHKFIEKDRLPVAPKHPTTTAILEELTKDTKVREELSTKSSELDDNLKQVYVTSFHKPYTNEDEKEKLRNTKLPQERGIVPDFQYGHTEPVVVPKGKYSLSQIIDIMMEHINDPMVNTPQVLAEKYSIDVKTIECIIRYFRLFKLQRVDSKESQKLLVNEKTAAFAQMEKFMSQQTIYKLATQTPSEADEEFDELTKKYEETRKKGTGGKETKPSEDEREREDRFEVKPDNKFEIDIDSIYKNVADRKRKKKEESTGQGV